jgi:three-Cys-motif partner protein
MGQVNWNDLVARVAQDDGLPVREVGEWSEDKLFFWHKYIQLTTTAMANNPRWSGGLVYVDLFAGPGVCKIRETGKRLPGSPLLAAAAAKPFNKIIAVECDADLAKALRSRLSAQTESGVAVVLQGDCNSLIDQVASNIPVGSLTLAFIDPEALDHRFETIERLAEAGAVDMLLLFADAYDIVRNIERYVENPNSKLDRVLGPGADWRPGYQSLGNLESATIREYFATVYKKQLSARLGYKGFSEKVITRRGVPLYRLIYASKHSRGLDFWEKILKKDKQGQGDLF